VRSYGDNFYFITDGISSCRLVVDESGDVVAEYDADEFGNPTVVNESGTTTPARYVGALGYRDEVAETGLYYLRQRYYDPSLGRFLSRDALGGLNRYGYAYNNPLKFVDVTGLKPTVIIIVGHRGEGSHNAGRTFWNIASRVKKSYGSTCDVAVWPRPGEHPSRENLEAFLKPYQGQEVQDMYFIGHGGEDAFYLDWASGEGTNLYPHEVWQLPNFSVKGSVKVYACESGKGSDSLAENLAARYMCKGVGATTTCSFVNPDDPSSAAMKPDSGKPWKIFKPDIKRTLELIYQHLGP
jgi:RHS repeat-associated protein